MAAPTTKPPKIKDSIEGSRRTMDMGKRSEVETET
jgi:hypothetical protein